MRTPVPIPVSRSRRNPEEIKRRAVIPNLDRVSGSGKREQLDRIREARLGRGSQVFDSSEFASDQNTGRRRVGMIAYSKNIDRKKTTSNIRPKMNGGHSVVLRLDVSQC